MRAVGRIAPPVLSWNGLVAVLWRSGLVLVTSSLQEEVQASLTLQKIIKNPKRHTQMSKRIILRMVSLES